jgi:broad specificity phosphatase PhoE
MMLELILARHGQSHSNIDRTLIGTDTELTERGRRQATELGLWLARQGYDFSRIYASPLQRTRQTAEIVNAHFGLEIIYDYALRETEQSYLEQMPRRPDPLGADPVPPFRPEYEAMRGRVTRSTERILAENSRGQVLVIAHAGTCGTMIRAILGTQTLIVRTELTAVHCLSWENGLWNLQYINCQEHLNSPHPQNPTEKSV